MSTNLPTQKLINRVKRKIAKTDCKLLNLNLCDYSLFDVLEIIALTSTYHFNKYPKGKMCYTVKNSDVKNIIAGMGFKNIELVC